MEIKRLFRMVRYVTFFNSLQRGNYIRRKKVFGSCGDNVHLPFMLIPFRAENIYLGNNIEVASGVRLIPHDAIHSVFNNITGNKETIKEYVGKIDIKDNVFIGSGSIVLGGVTIGQNVIVGAGTVVNKDIPSNSVWGGTRKMHWNIRWLNGKKEKSFNR